MVTLDYGLVMVTLDYGLIMVTLDYGLVMVTLNYGVMRNYSCRLMSSNYDYAEEYAYSVAEENSRLWQNATCTLLAILNSCL